MSLLDRLFRRTPRAPQADRPIVAQHLQSSERKAMPLLLAIESNPRGDYSISRNLTTHFVENWKTSHSGGTVTERDRHKDGTSLHRPSVDCRCLHTRRAALARDEEGASHLK